MKSGVFEKREKNMSVSFKKIFIYVASVLAALVLFPINVCAEPELMPDGQYFDAEYYAEHNPDVEKYAVLQRKDFMLIISSLEKKRGGILLIPRCLMIRIFWLCPAWT